MTSLEIYAPTHFLYQILHLKLSNLTLMHEPNTKKLLVKIRRNLKAIGTFQALSNHKTLAKLELPTEPKVPRFQNCSVIQHKQTACCNSKQTYSTFL